MTTVACSLIERVMCSDSIYLDGPESGPVRKLWRHDGVLYGMAGYLCLQRAAKAWLRTGRSPPRGNITLLALNSRIRTWDPLNGWIDIDTKQFAIGTGQQAARAAMLAGLTCAKAVRIAITLDPLSGGRVRSLRLPEG